MSAEDDGVPWQLLACAINIACGVVWAFIATWSMAALCFGVAALLIWRTPTIRRLP